MADLLDCVYRGDDGALLSLITAGGTLRVARTRNGDATRASARECSQACIGVRPAASAPDSRPQHAV